MKPTALNESLQMSPKLNWGRDHLIAKKVFFGLCSYRINQSDYDVQGNIANINQDMVRLAFKLAPDVLKSINSMFPAD